MCDWIRARSRFRRFAKIPISKCIQTSRGDVKQSNPIHPQSQLTEPALKMLTDFLQDQGTLYASGGMTAEQREPFELVLEFHDELCKFVAGLTEVGASLTLASLPIAGIPVPPALKSRIGGLIGGRPQHSTPEGMVATGPDCLVQWVNPAFTAMCGYALDELRGKKLGPVLQGAKTDPETAARMRRAVQHYLPCRETILNYHKNGTPYWVEVAITPILDDAGQPLWMVARERELIDPVAA
jgi:PAS domain S-box-containing protein